MKSVLEAKHGRVQCQAKKEKGMWEKLKQNLFMNC